MREQIEIKAEFWCAVWYSGQLFHFLVANLGKVNHSENEFYQMKSYISSHRFTDSIQHVFSICFLHAKYEVVTGMKQIINTEMVHGKK